MKVDKKKQWAYVLYCLRPRNQKSSETCEQDKILFNWLKEHVDPNGKETIHLNPIHDLDDAPIYSLRGLTTAMDYYETFRKTYEGVTLVVPYASCIPKPFWDSFADEERPVSVHVVTTEALHANSNINQ